jgi:hypothetical protein
MGKLTDRTRRKEQERLRREREQAEALAKEVGLGGFKPASMGDMLRAIAGNASVGAKPNAR